MDVKGDKDIEESCLEACRYLGKRPRNKIKDSPWVIHIYLRHFCLAFVNTSYLHHMPLLPSLNTLSLRLWMIVHVCNRMAMQIVNNLYWLIYSFIPEPPGAIPSYLAPLQYCSMIQQLKG